MNVAKSSKTKTKKTKVKEKKENGRKIENVPEAYDMNCSTINHPV